MRSRSEQATVLLLLSTTLLTAACRSDGPDATSLATATVRDSAGVTIVENPAPGEDVSPGWEVGPSPTVEIGLLDGPEAYQLFRVRDARRLADGRIAVVNTGSQEVRLYGADGVHLENWGGQGEGPGEFMNPTTISWWPGDSVAVWDQRLRRLAIFTLEGDLGRTLSFPAIDDMPAPLFSHVLAGGDAVVRATVFTDEDLSTGMMRQPVDVAVVDRDGRLVASLGSHLGREGYIVIGNGTVSIFAMPFFRDAVIEAAGSHSIIGATDRFEFGLWDGEGALSRIVRVAIPPRLITDAEKSAVLDRRLAEASEEDRPGIRRTWEEIPMSDTLPAHAALVVDDGGNAWIQTFRLPVDEGPARWLVLDPDGQVLGRVTLPENLTVYEIGTDYILGAATDDLGVERVQMWPLRRH